MGLNPCIGEEEQRVLRAIFIAPEDVNVPQFRAKHPKDRKIVDRLIGRYITTRSDHYRLTLAGLYACDMDGARHIIEMFNALIPALQKLYVADPAGQKNIPLVLEQARANGLPSVVAADATRALSYVLPELNVCGGWNWGSSGTTISSFTLTDLVYDLEPLPIRVLADEVPGPPVAFITVERIQAAADDVIRFMAHYRTTPLDPNVGKHEFSGPTLMESVGISPGLLNDAVMMSESTGFVTSVADRAAAPYRFRRVWLTDDGRAYARELQDGCARRQPTAPPVRALDISALHDSVKRVAERLATDGHLRQAVMDTYIALDNEVASRSGLGENGDALMNKAFAPRVGTAAVLQLSTNDEEQTGFMFLYKGAMKAVRNRYTHRSDLAPGSAEEAAEWLAFVSLLFRVLDSAKRN
ncbi:TIGR02391 family protein [Anaeromyxobacter diazotrophicus]|uniref:Conserved hypothetical protein CHP02391 domain-containing protein n=1 Tax=Anaeromyxobacter diazotrophicus TaxID=2590199 RepID=A0A7I9VJU3_9BACT|nr:TIGR02391 family protein [Anaeromyxobacter diazotrophicus]GEJ56676.1 hypothetical protein AMYX_14170 [Anaeromyxobacter diazotrophicus]